MENSFKIPEPGVDESKWLVVGPAQYTALREERDNLRAALVELVEPKQFPGELCF